LQDLFSFKEEEIECKDIQGIRTSLKTTLCASTKGCNAVFQKVIFVYQQDLKEEKAEIQQVLSTFSPSIAQNIEYISIFTDGLIFKSYVLDEEQIYNVHEVNYINLETAKYADDAYLWFDSFFLRQYNVQPTSHDIVCRFGLKSPIFSVVAQTLHKLLRILETTEAGALEVKQHQWAHHLARVYGNTNVTSNELFIRHTYLCQFAKFLVYASRFGVEKTKQEIEDVIGGAAFERLGVKNIGEQDFFAWTLSETIKDEALEVLKRVAMSLKVYNLRNIHEDLLKQLYQNLVEPETRHNLEQGLQAWNYLPGHALARSGSPAQERDQSL
jgi:hypothetical protein